MSLDAPISTLLADLREAVDRWGGIVWVAGRRDQDAVVVLFRRSDPDAPLEGVRVVDADPRALESDALFEIVSTDGPSVKLPVHWADGLVPDPTAVRWRGGAIAQSARLALQRFGTSAQGCEGAPL